MIYADGSKEVLPCVHQYFWKSTKFAKHIDLLRSKRRVVLTEDKITENKGRAEGFFERISYIGYSTSMTLCSTTRACAFASWEG